MTTGIVKKGSRYYFNPANSALYPWSPDLARVPGLLLFTAPKDGDFDMGMTLAEAQEGAKADVAAEAAAQEQAKAAEKESLLARAEHAVAGAAEGVESEFERALRGHPSEAPTLTVTDQPD